VAQQKYSAFDRELFACFAGIRHFGYMLDGRRFAIFTDHKPLTYALPRVSETWTARQTRQLSYVAEYTSDIRRIAGAANVVADTLSRPPGHAAAEKPPSAATCVKAPSGSQVVALQGGLYSVLQFSYPLLFKFFILHLPSYGVDYFDNDCSLTLL
jgi:hypothetical protein